MIIDMHMHEMRYSSDSHLYLEQMVAIARSRGLDAICITDHDHMGLKEFAEEYSRAVDFRIFVGVESYTLQGDIVAFGIDKYPRKRINAQDFIDNVHAEGGICFSAHPWRNNRRGLENALDSVKDLDGIEVLNGSTFLDANLKAVHYAQKYDLATIASSDCHVPQKLGIYATYFPNTINTVDELIIAVKNRETKPVYYKDNSYHSWDMKSEIDAPFNIEEISNNIHVPKYIPSWEQAI